MSHVCKDDSVCTVCDSWAKFHIILIMGYDLSWMSPWNCGVVQYLRKDAQSESVGCP